MKDLTPGCNKGKGFDEVRVCTKGAITFNTGGQTALKLDATKPDDSYPEPGP